MQGDDSATQVQSIEVEVEVLRCGCGDPDSHQGQVCPQPQREALGVQSAYYGPAVQRPTANTQD